MVDTKLKEAVDAGLDGMISKLRSLEADPGAYSTSDCLVMAQVLHRLVQMRLDIPGLQSPNMTAKEKDALDLCESILLERVRTWNSEVDEPGYSGSIDCATMALQRVIYIRGLGATPTPQGR